ncbi:MAG: hypothetical protein RI998_1042 [Pseudomonadota bacterium]|jgi:hypothetical protein
MNLLPCVARIINQRLGGLGARARWLVLLLVWGLSGCSLVVTGYNNGPQLVLFTWLNPHLDLSSAQERQVVADLTQVQNWHRQQQLPLYVHWLQEMQAVAPGPVQAAQVCKWFDEMRESLTPVASQMEAPTARLALSLQPDQFRVLKKRFDKDNQKWRDEWQMDGSAQDQLEVQTDKGQENAERIYGRLSSSQKTLLRQLAQSSGFDIRKTWDERLRQQADAAQVLQAIASKQPAISDATVLVREWFDRSLHTPDESYAAYLKKRQHINCEAAAQFHNASSASQRAHAVKVLKGYEEDVRKMMRTSG